MLRYEDFHPYLNYWLKMLSTSDNTRKSLAYVQHIHRFLEAYEYQSVLRLIRRHEAYGRRHSKA